MLHDVALPLLGENTMFIARKQGCGVGVGVGVGVARSRGSEPGVGVGVGADQAALTPTPERLL